MSWGVGIGEKKLDYCILECFQFNCVIVEEDNPLTRLSRPRKLRTETNLNSLSVSTLSQTLPTYLEANSSLTSYKRNSWKLKWKNVQFTSEFIPEHYDKQVFTIRQKPKQSREKDDWVCDPTSSLVPVLCPSGLSLAVPGWYLPLILIESHRST